MAFWIRLELGSKCRDLRVEGYREWRFADSEFKVYGLGFQGLGLKVSKAPRALKAFTV